MLKNFLFTVILLVGCSLAAFGQSSNTPPKEKPPKVKIEPKPAPTPTPKPTPKPTMGQTDRSEKQENEGSEKLQEIELV
jgi:hypothetical protein